MTCLRRASEPVRYAMIGGLVALINNIILIGGDRLGIAYPMLVVITWLTGGSAAFVMHCRITFRAVPSWGSYAQFMLGVAFGIPLSLAMFFILLTWLKLPMWGAAPLATLGMFIYNYCSARIAILWRWWQPGHAAVGDEHGG